jgi:hypothetical protein
VAAPSSTIHFHTEGEDFRSKGNAAADREADSASADQSETSVTEREFPFLTNEEKFVFWETRPNGLVCHVSGDLRDPVKKLIKASLLAEWSSKPTQGSLARSHGGGFLSQLEAVRKARRELAPFPSPRLDTTAPHGRQTDLPQGCPHEGEYALPSLREATAVVIARFQVCDRLWDCPAAPNHYGHDSPVPVVCSTSIPGTPPSAQAHASPRTAPVAMV